MSSLNQKALKELGRAVERQRKVLGLNQKALSEMAEVGINFVSQLESGKTTARISKILNVLRALGLQFKLELGKSGIQISHE